MYQYNNNNSKETQAYQPKRRRIMNITRLSLIVGVMVCGNASANYSSEASNMLTLGVSASVGPEYSGAKKMEFSVFPVFDYQMHNGLFASTLRGVGYQGDIGNFDYSAALNYRQGRKSKDLRNNRDKKGTLKGMGNVKGSMVADLALGYSLTDYLNVNIKTDLAITEDKNGNAFQVGMDASLLKTDLHQIVWNVTSHFADSKYMQTYYGVNSRQAQKTGLKSYHPGAGIYAVSTELSWRLGGAEGWSLTTQAGVAQLLGDASKGPLVRRKFEPSTGVIFAYTF